MSTGDNLDQIEKDKYQTVWSYQEYRRWSPGCDEQERAIDLFDQSRIHDPNYTPSMRDYGCGEGWTVQYFKEAGWDASGVEHAKNAVKASGILVYEKCLWDMLELPRTDYAFCCDVMEHIPPMKVNLVLHYIAALTRHSAYFRIANRPDGFGPSILGKPLHLTVEDEKWWKKTLERHWGMVKQLPCGKGSCVFICASPKPVRRAELESTQTE